jgi:UDP-N-acetylglucosamine transferase subunit ALG13
MAGAEKILSQGQADRTTAVIFVTVGTDEHPFDRLIREVDSLKERGVIREEVFIQIGFAHYHPAHCPFAEILTYKEMEEKMRDARIIITHGGPGSIMPVLYSGKVPVVVPRRKRYGEVVDEHQVSFARKLEKEGRIILVEAIEDLGAKVEEYETRAQELTSRIKKDRISPEENLSRFVRALEEICLDVIQKRKSRRSKSDSEKE